MNNRLIVAFAAFVVWTAITVGVGRLLAGGETSLQDGATSGIGWAWVLAAAFVLSVVLLLRWNDVGLDRGAIPGTWRLTWLPMLYIVIALVVSAVAGLPPSAMLLVILVNCLFVGFSEELMFRGAILQGLRHTLSIWPAVILTSVAFGSIHSLNVFVTGDLKATLIQSSAAFLSGLVFIALRLRTGSLWPPIIVHALWDFATFTLGAAIGQVAMHGTMPAEAAVPASPSALAQFAPILLVLPNAIYGLWLMRDIRRTHADPNV